MLRGTDIIWLLLTLFILWEHVSPDKSLRLQQYLDTADTALYNAKARGLLAESSSQFSVVT